MLHIRPPHDVHLRKQEQAAGKIFFEFESENYQFLDVESWVNYINRFP